MAKALQSAVDTFVKGMGDHKYPPCFTARQYKSWLEMEEIAKTQPIRAFVCRDCPSDHQARMVADNRCLNPNINVDLISD